eukprot:TRINITY_DN8903_c0_g1_i1.p1 TRINITY_DN8903_c0_g1~~TRINITY_DN8903_c0_g1_i1.p1  ORF type:complete len:404 (+),score=55.48 TRINITY_DN8903_c0_g1_i1:159-1370(+)
MHRRVGKHVLTIPEVRVDGSWDRQRCLSEMRRVTAFKHAVQDQRAASRELVTQTIALLDRMVSANAEVGPETYAEAMLVAVAHNRKDGVEAMYRHMRLNKVEASEWVHVVRLRMMARDRECCYEDEIERTLAEIARVQERGGRRIRKPGNLKGRAPLSSDVYQTILMYYAVRNDRDGASRVVAEMRRWHATLGRQTWVYLVKVMPRSRSELAGLLRSCRRELRGLPDVVLVAAIQKARKFHAPAFDLAMGLHAQIERKTTRSYNELLHATSTVVETTRVLDLLRSDASVEANATTYDIVIRVAGGKSLALARQAFDSARARGILDSPYIFTSMMRAYALELQINPRQSRQLRSSAEDLRRLAVQERAFTQKCGEFYDQCVSTAQSDGGVAACPGGVPPHAVSS